MIELKDIITERKKEKNLTRWAQQQSLRKEDRISEC